MYRKIASSNMSRLEAHVGFFRLLMMGIFCPFVLCPFDKKQIFELVMRTRTRGYTVTQKFFYVIFEFKTLFQSSFMNLRCLICNTYEIFMLQQKVVKILVEYTQYTTDLRSKYKNIKSQFLMIPIPHSLLKFLKFSLFI